jgi:endonuclease YncB( thermonuclease family)
VSQKRRIFRSSYSTPSRWRGALWCVLFSFAGISLVGLGLPANLFGSAPHEQDWAATAQSVRVLDGDTLLLGERTLRLTGLLSPQRGQTCHTPGGVGFDCGATAAQALAQLVQGRDLSCHVKGRDRFGRPMGTCQAGETGVNAALVSAGWALADKDDAIMASLEDAARVARRGLWSFPEGAPEHWRQR